MPPSLIQNDRSSLTATNFVPLDDGTQVAARTSYWTIFWAVLIPLGVLLLVTILCRVSPLDLWVSGLFYSFDEREFWFVGSFTASLIYDYSPLPGIVFASFGLATFVLGRWIGPLRPWRKQGLLFALVVIIGPGILVNSIFKPHWNRPRPSQIAPFGGTAQYVPPAMVGDYQNAKSFPSGHASMGFVFMAPAFLLFYHRRRLAAAYMAGGLLMGGVIGICRVAEGGHFLSDVVWSGAIVYFTCLAVVLGMQVWREPREIHPPRLLELSPGTIPLGADFERYQSLPEVGRAPAA